MVEHARPVVGDAAPGAVPCLHRGCTSSFGERWATAPNAVTALRVCGTVACWAAAVRTGDETWLLAALLCYWVGDMLDGLVARLTQRETRTGAVLDVLADRLSVCLVVSTYVANHPAAVVPAAIFLVQFVVVDAHLTLSFARWSLLSPNYFALVDPAVYRWNWSPPAKVTNTAAVVLVVLLTGAMATAAALAASVLCVKLLSAARLTRLHSPRELSGCAVLDTHLAANR